MDSEHVRLRLTSREKGQITVESKGFSTAANDDGLTVVSTGEVRIHLSFPVLLALSIGVSLALTHSLTPCNPKSLNSPSRPLSAEMQN